ncbi:MAG: molybdenum cofactor guanylyltransferase [Ignisphaera sp.]
MISVAVLAGGSSTRFFVNKLFYPFKGRPLVMYIIERLGLCRNVMKVIAIASPYNVHNLVDLGVETVVDNLCIGPIGGIYIATKMFNRVLVIGGDMPNISCSYIEKIDELCVKDAYACIPTWGGVYMEPLAAIYTNKITNIIEYGIASTEYSIQRLLRKLKVDVQFIHIDTELSEYREVFRSINTLEDVEEIMG